MWNRAVRLLMMVVAMATCVSLYAQPKTNSPLSSFGLGDYKPADFIAAGSMGGVGAVYHHPYVTNIVNPASLGFLKATSFEIAVYGRWARLQDVDEQPDIWSGNLDYLSLSIPLINPINQLLERRETPISGALNISIAPVSQVGYLILFEGEKEGVGEVRSIFRGKGGTNRLNLGTGWKYDRIAFGVNMAMLFGALEYQTITELPDLQNGYDHLSQNDYTIRGFLYDLGAMYELPISKSKRGLNRNITFGAHFNTKTSFTGKDDFINMVSNPQTLDNDTSLYLLDSPLEGTMPSQFGVGVMMEEVNRMRLAATFTAVDWSQYTNSARPEQLLSTWKASFGGSFTPDATSITSYLSRVEYRGGAFYSTDPRELNGTQATEYGFSVGAGFPFVQQRLFSFVDFSFEYGWRGVADSLRENYLRFRVGINMNDTQWFIKRRFN